MTITYTNHAKVIYDYLKSIIKTEFPIFARPDKFIFRDRPLTKDFGLEEFIRIAVISDNFESHQTSGGTDFYLINLHYYRKIEPEVKYDLITDFGEHLWELFNDYRAATTYWHNCRVNMIDYTDIPLPEMTDLKNPFINIYGFTMQLQISKGKY